MLAEHRRAAAAPDARADRRDRGRAAASARSRTSSCSPPTQRLAGAGAGAERGDHRARRPASAPPPARCTASPWRSRTTSTSRGVVTTNASTVGVPPPAERDATVVARLRAAGAELLCKTNLLEYAAGSVNPAYGMTFNPRDRSRTSGGSSSGSAALVAAGVCDYALGTDTGGSIRIPAAYCGIVGLKPTLRPRAGRRRVPALADRATTSARSRATVAQTAPLLGVLAGAPLELRPVAGPARRRAAPPARRPRPRCPAVARAGARGDRRARAQPASRSSTSTSPSSTSSTTRSARSSCARPGTSTASCFEREARRLRPGHAGAARARRARRRRRLPRRDSPTRSGSPPRSRASSRGRPCSPGRRSRIRRRPRTRRSARPRATSRAGSPARTTSPACPAVSLPCGARRGHAACRAPARRRARQRRAAPVRRPTSTRRSAP